MTRTYEYWTVNPETWGDSELLDTVTGCTVTRDSDDETLGSASFSMDSWEGERYVRVYLIATQDGVRERVPIGTYLVQASSREFDGMRGYMSVTGYTPLKELLDDGPPLGFSVSSGYATKQAARLMSLYARMPVGDVESAGAVQEAYVAKPEDTWIGYINGLLAMGSFHIALDGRGNALLAPDQSADAAAPVFTFSDDKASILQPSVSVTNNLGETPNVVEVVYSTDTGYLVARVENSSESSESSTKTLGRQKLHRENSPDLPDSPTQSDVNQYAAKLMKELGAATYEATFRHGFVPDLNLGVAVRLDYKAMGLDTVGVIVNQSIECTPACQVTTTVRYTRESVL